MKRYYYLSHVITGKTPVYGKGAPVDITRVKTLSKGDSANTYKFAMGNHAGTHIDAPNHFFKQGMKISDYPAGYFIFKSPLVIRRRLKKGEILGNGEWLKQIRARNDILLLDTGWSRARNKNRYIQESPGIHPEVGFYLRRHHPHLKAIGIDCISISSIKNRPLGRMAHKAFLNPRGVNKPILIIEDMLLPNGLPPLSEVFVLPLRVEGIDSAPCTIIGRAA